MARLLTGMWILLIASLSSMVLLMGDFLSERKHVEVASPTTLPLARGPRGYVADEVGVATAKVERPTAPLGERLPEVEAGSQELGADEPKYVSPDSVGGDTADRTTGLAAETQNAEADPQQLSADGPQAHPVALSRPTARRPPSKSARVARSEKTSPSPTYQKKMKRRGLLERRASRRFGNRRLFVTR